jgi:hypothetical protein
MPIPTLLSILEISPLVVAVKCHEAIAPSVIADWKLPPLGGSTFTDNVFLVTQFIITSNSQVKYLHLKVERLPIGVRDSSRLLTA